MIKDARLEALLSSLGKTEWRAGQQELLSWAIAGHACLGVLPTGSGKSLCYQIAALAMEGTSVVVSPLIALMRDQVQQLCAYDVAAQQWDSSLSAEEKSELLRRLRAGELKILFVAPESLEQADLCACLAEIPLGLFVVDEAHCVSEWGHSFRPNYLKLPAWSRRYKFRALMALTATATPAVRRDLQAAFGIEPAHEFCLSPYRANIARRVMISSDKGQDVADFLRESGHQPAIVYCRSRKGTEELGAFLEAQGFVARAYHAGQDVGQRLEIQDAFFRGEIEVLVATIAFGMGVDKSNVRAVIHYDAPSSPESYVQESGRAGRDGAAAQSLLLLDQSDFVENRNRILADMPDEEALTRCARWLVPPNRRVVSLWDLTTQCDVSEDLPLRILSQLEGRVLASERGFKFYKVRPLFAMSTILDGRDAMEVARLTWLNEHRDGELEDAALAWDCDFVEAMTYLRDCEASQEWRVDFRQIAMELQRVDEVCPQSIAQNLMTYYERRRDSSLQRWETLAEMMLAPDCLNAALERYFMEADAVELCCKSCSSCLSEKRDLSEAPDLLVSDMPPHADLPEFARDGQLKRFLLGMVSPSLMRRRLWSHPHYGAMAGAAWEDLL